MAEGPNVRKPTKLEKKITADKCAHKKKYVTQLKLADMQMERKQDTKSAAH